MSGPRRGTEGWRAPRRGTIYVLVLGAASLVTMLGLCGLMVVRLELRAAAMSSGRHEADLLAMSAVEHALRTIGDAEAAAEVSGGSWRDAFTDGATGATLVLGHGTMSWRLVDDSGDGDLADDPSEPIRIVGRGVVGEAKRVYSVLAAPGGDGRAVLATVLHTAGDLTNSLTLINASGGPISAAGALSNGGVIDGDVEAGSAPLPGIILGTLTVPAPPKSMPPGSIFDVYAARATEIPWTSFDGGGGQLQAPLLSAGVNPWGEANPDGAYFIRVPAGAQLKIRVSRIRGTLVVDLAGNARLKISNPVFAAPHRPDYPVLIVKCDPTATVELVPAAGLVLESAVGATLNPEHTPYDGAWDDDLADAYSPEIQGLVHVIGGEEVQIGGNLLVRGTLLSEARVGTSGLATPGFILDPDLFANPPLGYAEGGAMVPISGSWRREVDETW
jgi:hypothetical protein